MFSRVTIFIIPFALFAGGCVYNTSEQFFVQPVPDEPAEILVTTSLDTLDQPAATDSLDLEIEYTIEIRNGKPYIVDCWLEDYHLYEVDVIFFRDSIYLVGTDFELTVISDTTLLVVEPDTILEFVKDPIHNSYLLAGSFLVTSRIPLEPGEYPLCFSFYYSSNTNSLGDIYGLEAEVKDLEYTIILGGSQP
jgi:hypothetical protein